MCWRVGFGLQRHKKQSDGTITDVVEEAENSANKTKGRRLESSSWFLISGKNVLMHPFCAKLNFYANAFPLDPYFHAYRPRRYIEVVITVYGVVKLTLTKKRQSKEKLSTRWEVLTASMIECVLLAILCGSCEHFWPACSVKWSCPPPPHPPTKWLIYACIPDISLLNITSQIRHCSNGNHLFEMIYWVFLWTRWTEEEKVSEEKAGLSGQREK